MGEGGKRARAGEVSVVQASCKCLNGLGNNESNTKCAVRLGSDRVHRLDSPFPNRCLVREAAASRCRPQQRCKMEDLNLFLLYHHGKTILDFGWKKTKLDQ